MKNQQKDEQSEKTDGTSSQSDDGASEDDQSSSTTYNGSDTTMPSEGDRDRRRRHSTRNQERAGEGGSGLTLEGLITFFTYGSGVLLVLIIAFFLYNQFIGASGAGTGQRDTANSSGNRDGVSINAGDDVSIEAVDEEGNIDLRTRKGRGAMKQKVEKIIGEIRNADSFREGHSDHIDKLQNHITTIIDYVGALSSPDSVDPDLKTAAEQANDQAVQLMKELTRAYDGTETVSKKISDLNYDVLWEVQEQRDKIQEAKR